MNLILQSIKALFRGVENRLSTSIAVLTQKVTTVQKTASTASKKATAAQIMADQAKTAADNAQTTADNAQTTADNAQTTADNAKTAANAKATRRSYDLSFSGHDFKDALNLEVGGAYSITHDGYLVTNNFFDGDNIHVGIGAQIDASTRSTGHASLTAISSYTAQGLLVWTITEKAQTMVFAVRLKNFSTTSDITLIRIA